MISFLNLQTVESVLGMLDDLAPVGHEEISVFEARGRTLAFEFAAPEDLPGFTRSTVDGFAVRARDVFGASEGIPALLELCGECPMGLVPEFELGAGQSAVIWTGGMLPVGADAVVMLEYSREAGHGKIELTRPVAPLDNTMARDEDVAHGQSLLPSGAVLEPQDLGLLAALGQETVVVRRRPKIAVLANGDELVPIGSGQEPGKIRESNSPTLCAMIDAMGGQAFFLGLVPDDLEKLVTCLQQGLAFADTVLVTGGSSAGQRDFTLSAFAGLPGWEVLVHGIAMRPGKPTILASNGRQTLWGLPGNPTAAFITAEIFVRRMMEVLLGQSHAQFSHKRRITARLSRRVASVQGRRDYIRVRLEPGDQKDGFLIAVPLLGSSGLVSNPAKADGLVVCHESQEGLEAGQVLEVHMLRA